MFNINLERTVEILSKNPHKIKTYSPQEIGEYVERLQMLQMPIVAKQAREYFNTGKKKSYKIVTTEYYNVPAAFDIETSSFLNEKGEKCGCMYVWQMAISGEILIGRTWYELLQCLNRIKDALGLNENRRLVIYIHNASYEFQWMRKYFNFSNVFATDERKPIYAITDGIEFKCSYMLSGYSLDNIHTSLYHYKVRKAVGDLDYSKVRHSATPLTWKEKYYCILDVIVVSAYIDEKIDQEGEIYKIPLTKTGYVRRHVRNETIGKKHSENEEERKRAWWYGKIMKELTLTPETYTLARRAYQGGFTHANGWKSGKIYYNASSQDESSAYPSVVVCEKFPMSAPLDVTDKIHSMEELLDYAKKYALLIDVGFENLESTCMQERILSYSKAINNPQCSLDNGRIVTADRARFVMTEIDFCCVKAFYRWEKMKIFSVHAMRRGYLPTSFVKAVLDLYRDKTTLKNVKDKEYEYALKKELLNSCYGCMVTAVIRDLLGYDYESGEWIETIHSDKRDADDIDTIIAQYNKDHNRFLYYLWGVYVTAYARRNVFSAILSLGEDYIYSDTDSVKYLHHEKHAEYFERYNRKITEKMEAAMRAHQLPIDYWRPKTIKGVEKPLGYWDREPDMLIFKTLGAKRYLYMDTDRNLHLTVAGLSKNDACNYLEKTYGKYGCFEKFSDGLIVPGEYTGKLTHYYIDEPRSGNVTDYLGNTAHFEERSCVYLEPAEYHLTVAPEYVALDAFLEAIFEIRTEH